MIIDGYLRVSSEEQAKGGLSLRSQKGKLAGYRQLYGTREGSEWDLGVVHSDDGVSAKSLKRPGLQAALERLDRGESQGLIVVKLDRLTRSLRDWNWLVDRYFGEKPGRKLVAVDNEVNTMTANGRMFLNLIVMMAQWERETTAERTREVLRDKISRGERCGKVRYGHTLDLDGPKNKRARPRNLLLDPHEQGAIALMRQMRGEGASLRAIAAELKARGYVTRDGRPDWAACTIWKILKRTG